MLFLKNVFLLKIKKIKKTSKIRFLVQMCLIFCISDFSILNANIPT